MVIAEGGRGEDRMGESRPLRLSDRAIRQVALASMLWQAQATTWPEQC